MGPVAPPSTVTTPPRDFGPDGAPNVYFSDPDVIAIDPLVQWLWRNRTRPIQRLWTGALWAEGPAWNAPGPFLSVATFPNNRQMRWIEDDGHVSVFRMPSNNSNGNTFDFQGRQISCEHLMRRVVRYELDGSVDRARGFVRGQAAELAQRRRSPSGRQHLVHRPALRRPALRGRSRHGRRAEQCRRAGSTRARPAAGIGDWKRELPTQIYRLDPNGTLTMVATEEQVPDPNGLCFSHDYKRLYVASTGKGPGDPGAGGKGNIFVFDVSDNKLTNHRLFTDCMVDGVKCGPDGVRCDVNGNLWASSNAGRAVGYSGVNVWSPDAKLLGRIRIPEICGNVCFGGPKRNRLFMAGSQSLYAVYTADPGGGARLITPRS